MLAFSELIFVSLASLEKKRVNGLFLPSWTKIRTISSDPVAPLRHFYNG